MKKLIALVMALVMIVPMNANAQKRDWWPTQIDESDEYHNIEKVGEWPDTVITNEIAKDVITFRPRVVAVQKMSKSVKVLADITTASKNVIVQYTVDGKRWYQQSYRNARYSGPVVCTRKWQCVLHKDDTNSSWCARQFSQGKESLDFKKVFRPRDYMAQLFFDDYLIDHTIRPKVVNPVILSIPAKAKKFKIRYKYTGLKKDVFSEWVEVKVR